MNTYLLDEDTFQLTQILSSHRFANQYHAIFSLTIPLLAIEHYIAVFASRIRSRRRQSRNKSLRRRVMFQQRRSGVRRDGSRVQLRFLRRVRQNRAYVYDAPRQARNLSASYAIRSRHVPEIIARTGFAPYPH